jgi:hypothetical protein
MPQKEFDDGEENTATLEFQGNSFDFVGFTQMTRRNRGPILAKGVGSWLMLDLRHQLLNLNNVVVAPAGQFRGLNPLLAKQLRLGNLETITAKLHVLEFRVNVTGVIMFAVTAQTKQGSNDQLGTLAGAGIADGLTDHAQAFR